MYADEPELVYACAGLRERLLKVVCLGMPLFTGHAREEVVCGYVGLYSHLN